MSNRPKVGVLGLMFDLYDKPYPDLKLGREKFLRNSLDIVRDEIDFRFPGACNTRESVEKCIKEFEIEKCDAILVVFLTYAPSFIALRPLLDCKLPIIIWNTQEAFEVSIESPANVVMENHGVHGVQDLTSVLKRIGRDFVIISGYWKDSKVLDRLVISLKTAGVFSKLKASRIGLLGYPLQGMGDFNLDETVFLANIGPTIIHIPLEELTDLIKEAPKDDIKSIMSKDYEDFDWDKAITEEEHEASARVEWAIRKLIQNYHLDGWSQNFMVLGRDKRILTLPFLAASKLMKEGIGYGAEGDVGVVVGFLIMKEISGQATMTEMFSIDFKSQALLMSHMGELNIGMAREDVRVKVLRNVFDLVEVLPPPTPVFSIKPGEATLLSIASTSNGKFQFIVAEGEVLDSPCIEDIGSPNFKWRPNCSLEEFLDKYSMAGGTHHLALSYGKLANVIKILGSFLKVEVIQIC